MSEANITSRQNPRVKQLVRLRQRKERDRSGLFLVEGWMELSRVLASGRKVQTLFTCPDFFREDRHMELVQAFAEVCEVVELSATVYEKCSLREGSDGLLGVIEQWPLELDALTLGSCPLVLVAESIEKPGNLGGLIRSAEAAGADAVIVCDPVTDVFNPNVVRASRGLVCVMPLALGTPDAVADMLESRGVRTVALMPEGEHCYWDIDWCQPAAVVAGSEWAGLSAFWESRAQVRATLPMRGAGDSLNVSVATAITLYEALRQRGS